MPRFWHIFRKPDIGMEMGPSIVALYSGLGPGKMAEWVGGRWAMIYRDRPETAEYFSEIKGPRFLGPNRGSGFLNLGTLRVAPLEASKWLRKYRITRRV